jgi:hypothetical protein
LVRKRFITFHRRLLLAIIIVLLAPFGQGVLSYLIGPSTIIPVKNIKLYPNISMDVNNYRRHNFPYRILDKETNEIKSFGSNPISELFSIFYQKKHRPDVFLFPLNDSIPEHVFGYQKDSYTRLLNDYFFGMQWRITEPFDINSLKITAYYSKMAYHSAGAILNEISNLLLSLLSSNSLSKTIKTYNAPFMSDETRYTGDNLVKYLGCFDIIPLSLFNLVTSIVVAFMISSLVMHISRERLTGSKSLQLLSGTQGSTYWISNYIFDYFLCFVSVSLLIVAISFAALARRDRGEITDITVIAEAQNIGYLYLLLIMNSLSWPFIVYCWSFFIKSDLTSFIVLFIILATAAFLDMTFAFVHLFVHINDRAAQFNDFKSSIMHFLRITFSLIFPNVTIKRALFDMKIRFLSFFIKVFLIFKIKFFILNYFKRDNEYCVNTLNRILRSNYRVDSGYLAIDEPGIGIFFVFSFIQLLFFLVFLIALQTRVFNKSFLKSLIGKVNNYEKEISEKKIVN